MSAQPKLRDDSRGLLGVNYSDPVDLSATTSEVLHFGPSYEAAIPMIGGYLDRNRMQFIAVSAHSLFGPVQDEDPRSPSRVYTEPGERLAEELAIEGVFAPQISLGKLLFRKEVTVRTRELPKLRPYVALDPDLPE